MGKHFTLELYAEILSLNDIAIWVVKYECKYEYNVRIRYAC